VEIEEKIFEVVNHLNRGAALIDSPQEREQVAAFTLSAGKRAKASTAYATALAHFTAACALLALESWAQQDAMTCASSLVQLISQQRVYFEISCTVSLLG
jgi:predicted ATPase